MSENKSSPGQQNLPLSFIDVSGENATKDPARQQLARTRAINHSIHRRRQQLQLTNQNFVDETQRVTTRQKRRTSQDDPDEDAPQSPPLRRPVTGTSVDAFDSIAVNPVRLGTLLRHRTARQAGDPVFSVSDTITFQQLDSVFNANPLTAGPLTSALALVLAFTANGSQMDEECASYRLKTIQFVNEKLSDPAEAATTATMGAILLLVGIETRLGERQTTQMHLNGIQQLWKLCAERNVPLHSAIRRAVFWQDLFSAMMAGTARICRYEDFPEVYWERDHCRPELYAIPIGFADRQDVLGAEFLETMADLSALRMLCETPPPPEGLSNDEIKMIDNQQAWIENRLVELRPATSQPLLRCCTTAAFLCSYGCFVEVFGGQLIPSHLTPILLRELQDCQHWGGWDEHNDLLLWLLNVGCAFSTDARVQHGFAALLQGPHRRRLQPLAHSWSEVESTLKKFIWSDRLHGPPQSAAFWQRFQELQEV